MTKPTKIIRSISKDNGLPLNAIIIDDFDDKDIAVSPEIVAKRLKWIQSSLIPNRSSPSFVGDKVIAYADIAGGTDREVTSMVTLINGELIYLVLNPD